MFVCSASFKGCFAVPESSKHLAPCNAAVGGGDGWSKLPAVGSPAVLKPSEGRERGAGQSSRLCSAEFPKPLPVESFTGREGPSPGGHKCTAASLPSCLPGQGVPPETSALVISSTWELPTYIFGFGCCCIVFLLFACFLPLPAVLVLTAVKN